MGCAITDKHCSKGIIPFRNLTVRDTGLTVFALRGIRVALVDAHREPLTALGC